MLLAAFTAVLSGKTLVACFFFFFPLEDNLLALAGVEKFHCAGLLLSASVVDKYSSSVADTFFFLILNEELLVHKCEWLTESTVDSKISKLADTYYVHS